MLKELAPEKIAIALSKETVTYFPRKTEELDAPRSIFAAMITSICPT